MSSILIDVKASTQAAVNEFKKLQSAMGSTASAGGGAMAGIGSAVSKAASLFSTLNLAIGGVKVAMDLGSTALKLYDQYLADHTMELRRAFEAQTKLRESVTLADGDFKKLANRLGATSGDMALLEAAAGTLSRQGFGPATEIFKDLIKAVDGNVDVLKEYNQAIDESGNKTTDANLAWLKLAELADKNPDALHNIIGSFLRWSDAARNAEAETSKLWSTAAQPPAWMVSGMKEPYPGFFALLGKPAKAKPPAGGGGRRGRGGAAQRAASTWGDTYDWRGEGAGDGLSAPLGGGLAGGALVGGVASPLGDIEGGLGSARVGVMGATGTVTKAVSKERTELQLLRDAALSTSQAFNELSTAMLDAAAASIADGAGAKAAAGQLAAGGLNAVKGLAMGKAKLEVAESIASFASGNFAGGAGHAAAAIGYTAAAALAGRLAGELGGGGGPSAGGGGGGGGGAGIPGRGFIPAGNAGAQGSTSTVINISGFHGDERALQRLIHKSLRDGQLSGTNPATQGSVSRTS